MIGKSEMKLRKEVTDELIRLSSAQRSIVLGGLKNKLGFQKKTGILSYRYDVCPVCKDIGSTIDNPKCDQCYIPISCKEPFNSGFRDNAKQGVEYFSSMFRFLNRLDTSGRTLVVGGTFDNDGGRQSGIIKKLGDVLGSEVINGGTLHDLKSTPTNGYELVIWAPNVPNAEDKFYPNKDRGAILICSKVMREGYTRFDSVSRIFRMRGNAVCEIRSVDKRFEFALVDALGNEWYSGSGIFELVKSIDDFIQWTKGSIRIGSTRSDTDIPDTDLEPLVKVVHRVAGLVENERGGRYFGNASTRCMAMFPSQRSGPTNIFVSARNIPKTHIANNDFVHVRLENDCIVYTGDRKPSVDTPAQLKLYDMFPKIGCMIHGHAFVKHSPCTENYVPCGDLREVDEAIPLLRDLGSVGVINLHSHGFLLFAETIEQLDNLVNDIEFINVVPISGQR